MTFEYEFLLWNVLKIFHYSNSVFCRGESFPNLPERQERASRRDLDRTYWTTGLKLHLGYWYYYQILNLLLLKYWPFLDTKFKFNDGYYLEMYLLGILDREKFLDILPLILVILCEQFMLTLYISVVNLAFVFKLFMEKIREITVLTIVI